MKITGQQFCSLSHTIAHDEEGDDELVVAWISTHFTIAGILIIRDQQNPAMYGWLAGSWRFPAHEPFAHLRAALAVSDACQPELVHLIIETQIPQRLS